MEHEDLSAAPEGKAADGQVHAGNSNADHSTPASGTTTKQAEAASSLAVALLRTASSPSESFVLSPFSMAIALAVIHEGAVGSAKKELTQLLLKGHSDNEIAEYYGKMALTLMDTASDAEEEEEGGRPTPTGQSPDEAVFDPYMDEGPSSATRVATRFFIGEPFIPMPSYQSSIVAKYGVDLEKVDFGKPEEAAETVNAFVKKETRGMIPEIVTASEVDNAKAILVNTVHFEARWLKEFDPSDTNEATFHGVNGDRKENLMSYSEMSRDYAEHKGVQILSLPYADIFSTSHALVVFLPAAGTFKQFRASLDGPRLLGYIKKLGSDEVKVKLPKFKTESGFTAKDILNKLGVEGIFHDGNLTAISDDPSFQISEIIHKGIIDVNEEGTEAAGMTACLLRGCGFGDGPPPPVYDFCADRPFIYAIVKDGEHLLFIGQYC